MLGRAGVLLAAILTFAAGALAQTAWHKVEGPAGLFVVEMPAKPAYKVEQAKSGGGTSFSFHTFSLDHDGKAFVAQTATYPADVDVSKPRANLELAFKASAKHLASKKWDQVAWTKFEGLDAVETTGKMNADVEFRNFIVLKGRQMYSLGFGGPPGSLRSPEADRFFGSMRLSR
jgi:hypothetical protein